jgi:hypothetical protein
MISTKWLVPICIHARSSRSAYIFYEQFTSAITEFVAVLRMFEVTRDPSRLLMWWISPSRSPDTSCKELTAHGGLPTKVHTSCLTTWLNHKEHHLMKINNAMSWWMKEHNGQGKAAGKHLSIFHACWRQTATNKQADVWMVLFFWPRFPQFLHYVSQ